MAQQMGLEGSSLDRITSANRAETQSAAKSKGEYRGAKGLDPEVVAEIEKRYGFDKPVGERYWIMIRDYLTFNFGDSFFKSGSVIDLVLEAMPVSISLGLWSTLIIYLISIPLGISKALKNGHLFDRWTSSVISLAYAIPGFLFAILLIIVFAGGNLF